MEIQLDSGEDLSWAVATLSDPISEPAFLNDAIISSSSGCGWRRLRGESMCLQPNIAPLWLKGIGAKMTDIDRDLDDEIYEKAKSDLAGILNLKDRSITNEEIDALSPMIQKIVDLVTPRDEDTKAKNKEKIDLLQQLANHSLAQDSTAKKLLDKDIKELRDANNTLVCAKGKHKGGELGHKIAKFWKKHKKAIIITAAVVAVTAAVVVVVAVMAGGAAAGAAAAGGAGAVGGALSDQGSKEKPHSQSNLDPSPTPASPTNAPTISYPFATFNPYPVPEKITFGENGVHYDGQFFSSYEDMLLNPFGNSWVNNWLNSAEKLRTEAFPLSHISMPQLQPIISNGNAHGSQDLNVSAYKARGEWALTNGYTAQALQDFNTIIEMEPSNPDSYLGRGSARFELGQYDACIDDYNQYTSLVPKEFSVKDFSIGFAKGLPKGVYESGEGLLLFLSDLVKHPINTGSQVYESFSALSNLVRAGEWEMIGSSLSPEVHELITQWEILSNSRKGELAGYAFGKHGSDILIPGAAAKIAARGAGAVKEIGVICKNLQTAEKVFVLEAVATGRNAGVDVGAVITSAERTLAAGEDLGLTAKEIAELKQAGNLEQVVDKGRDYFVGKPEMQASFDRFENAETFLKNHKGFVAEMEAKDLIHKTGISTFSRPEGIPEIYKVKISSDGAGIKYVHPQNDQTYVRVMPGKPHSMNPMQQKPYVVQMKNGLTLDKNGKVVNRKSPDAHIPLEEFRYIQ